MQNIIDIHNECKLLIATIFVKYEIHPQEIQYKIMDYYKSTQPPYGNNKAENYINLINMLVLEMCQSLSTKICRISPILKNSDKYKLFEQSIIQLTNE